MQNAKRPSDVIPYNHQLQRVCPSNVCGFAMTPLASTSTSRLLTVVLLVSISEIGRGVSVDTRTLWPQDVVPHSGKLHDSASTHTVANHQVHRTQQAHEAAPLAQRSDRPNMFGIGLVNLYVVSSHACMFCLPVFKGVISRLPVATEKCLRKLHYWCSTSTMHTCLLDPPHHQQQQRPPLLPAFS